MPDKTFEAEYKALQQKMAEGLTAGKEREKLATAARDALERAHKALAAFSPSASEDVRKAALAEVDKAKTNIEAYFNSAKTGQSNFIMVVK